MITNLAVSPISGAVGLLARAAVTVRSVFPEISPEVAVITEVPTARAVARPLLRVPFGFMVAIVMLPDDQMAEVVIMAVLPFE
jgi:hypothetical protein